MFLAPGAHLGPYTIVGLRHKDGREEVDRARDTRRRSEARKARLRARALVGLVLAWPILILACGGRGGSAPAAEITLVDRMNVALAAKRLCSAVWVSNRAEEEARWASVFSFLNERARRALDQGDLQFAVDRDSEITVASWSGTEIKAGFFGDQGCVILPEGTEQVYFTPVEVASALPDAQILEWPMGDVPPSAAPALDVDWAKVDEALEIAFSHPEDHTAAFLAVHGGRIIAGRYGDGADPQTQLESWSMGKSVTATLVGLLIHQGHLGLWDPAPVPEWQNTEGDPRAAIRVADLLRMSSGLFFTHSSDDEERLGLSFIPGQPDHSLGYVAPVDVFQFSESRPLEHEPNTVGRYRNCDPLVLGSIIKRTVEALGEEYLSWPQRALFDKIGTRRQVLETDAFGNFVLTGFDFGTAPGWARLGQLYLQDGIWQGERLLPEGFVDFVSSPAPAWAQGEYGGLFWVGHEALPDGAYSMRGAGGQEVSMVPSHDLVLVRLGHSVGAVGDYTERRNQAYRLIVEAVASH